MTTMLDKCAVAGDITQAIDRRGAWAVAITVIGGTNSTAVKLQSAETADGSFTDFKTLIASSEASAEQYKGFVVDLHGAKQFIKVVGATMATAVLGDCDHDVKKIAITAGEIPSGADLEDNKTATIDVSTYTEPVEITPIEGKDGMKKATVTLSNIPSGATPSTIEPSWYNNGRSIIPNGVNVVGVPTESSATQEVLIETGNGVKSIRDIFSNDIYTVSFEYICSFGNDIVGYLTLSPSE